MIVDGEEVTISEAGAVRVRSRSHPDEWHLVTSQFCGCPGFRIRGRCRHHDLFKRWNGGWPQAMDLPPFEGELRVATSRYQARGLILGSGLTPVGITLGRPRFRLGYQVPEYLRELAPDPWTFHLDDRAEFEPVFRRKLDRLGPDLIRRRLEQIVQRHEARGLVALCYEDVLGGAWCHREICAEWLQENLGIEVQELGAEKRS